MDSKIAKRFTAELITQCTLSNINPMILFNIAIAETGLKNKIGDDGKAVGYFQLHMETVWFVKQYYKIDRVPKQHTDLLYNVDLQIEIATKYFEYLTTKYTSIEEALKYWNGSERYVKYYLDISEYVSKLYNCFTREGI
jgi:hypothetical protein